MGSYESSAKMGILRLDAVSCEGGFTAIACSVLSSRLLASVAFESPGLTTFYHNLADQAC